MGTRNKTIKKYLKVLKEVSNHDKLLRKEIRKMAEKHQVSTNIDASMIELGYVTKGGRDVPCKIILRNPKKEHAKRCAEAGNERKEPNKTDNIGNNETKSLTDIINEDYVYVDRRIETYLEHHVKVYHYSRTKAWWQKNKTIIAILLIALASFLIGMVL
jgi:hypothetical protein